MDYYTLNHFARLAGVTVPTIIGHIQRGNIKTIYRRVKAIPVSELEPFLKAKKDRYGRRTLKRDRLKHLL